MNDFIRWPHAVLAVALVVSVAHSDPPPNASRYLALASRDWLIEQVGQLDPAKGWIGGDTYFDRPLQGTVYTLYGLSGKLAEVKTIDPMRLYKGGVPWDWSVHVSPWPWKLQEQALAVKGDLPPPPRVAETLPLDDEAALSAARNFLKDRRLNVPSPYLNQVFKVDLLGDGNAALVLSAHSDPKALVTEERAEIYAIVLLVLQQNGKENVLSVAAYTAVKPAHRTVEEQTKYFGPRPFYRVIAFPDLKGDGHLEIVTTKNGGTPAPVQIDEFDGRVLHTQLQGYTID